VRSIPTTELPEPKPSSSSVTVRGRVATGDVGKPCWIIFEMNWVAFAYFAALSIFSGIIFGFVPALRASRVDLNSAIKDGTPGGGNRGSRLRPITAWI
jgi:hypothetical protein